MLTQHHLLMLKDKKTTTARRDAPRRDAPRRDVLSDEASGDESADSVDSSALLQVTRAQQEQAPPKSFSEVEDPSTSFFGNISQDYDAEEKTSEAVTAKTGRIGPLQLGSRDQIFSEKIFILWAIT